MTRMARISRYYRYHLPDGGGSPDEDYYEFSSFFDPENGEFLAQDAAEDYHSNHDGWESSWPIELILLDSEGVLIGKYIVDRDVAPVFSAREVQK